MRFCLVAASLSYDHLGAEQSTGPKYDMLQNSAATEAHYEYPEVPSARQTRDTEPEGDYSYPDVRTDKNEIEEHFYEAIPTNSKTKSKEPSPYMEASPLATPKLSGMSTKAPPRPTYRPNEKSSDRLQGLNDLMASLEDIKVILTAVLIRHWSLGKQAFFALGTYNFQLVQWSPTDNGLCICQTQLRIGIYFQINNNAMEPDITATQIPSRDTIFTP